MPEIAEVETVRNTLKERILNKKIKDVKVLYKKMIETDLLEFLKILKGNTFHDIKRRGKWLMFILDEHVLLSHLRMEGKYFLKNKNEQINKHEHVIITFSDDTQLRYHDTRKFGVMALVKKEDVENYEGIKKQGIEIIDDNLTKDYLYDKFKKRKIPMKTLLLDQTIISGLGNIYADEVLFASRINPLKLGIDITLEECEKIKIEGKKIIDKAILEGGTTIRSYTSSLGVTGRFQQYLKVHKKEGESCIICHCKIKKIKVGGRSTYYCENCQKID